MKTETLRVEGVEKTSGAEALLHFCRGGTAEAVSFHSNFLSGDRLSSGKIRKQGERLGRLADAVARFEKGREGED